MQPDILMWIISGLCGATILLLSGIWSEIRKLNDKLADIAIHQAAQNGRIDTIEKIVDKLPCMNNLSCPGERR